MKSVGCRGGGGNVEKIDFRPTVPPQTPTPRRSGSAYENPELTWRMLIIYVPDSMVLSHVFGAVDKTSSSFSAHGKIGNFIIIIINNCTKIHSAAGGVAWHVAIPLKKFLAFTDVTLVNSSTP